MINARKLMIKKIVSSTVMINVYNVLKIMFYKLDNAVNKITTSIHKNKLVCNLMFKTANFLIRMVNV